jgi:DNA invertase Pin-like site-specific DNA recombinase
MNDEPDRQSAASDEQPGERFARLFEIAEHHGFNLVLIVRLDQLSRESTIVQAFLETLEKQGVKILTLGW